MGLVRLPSFSLRLGADELIGGCSVLLGSVGEGWAGRVSVDSGLEIKSVNEETTERGPGVGSEHEFLFL